MEQKRESGLSLDELLNRPEGLLALRGSDGDEGDSAASGTEGAEDKSNEGKSDEKTGEESKGKKTESEPKEDPRIAALTEEKQRFYDQREEAKLKLKEAQTELAKLKKEGTPDDALKQSNEELTKTNETLLSQNQALALENAFLKEAGYDWVDPEAALRLADLSKVEFDEKTGKAIGLSSALADLAKSKAYLLKQKADEGEKPKDDEKPKPRPTGQKPAGGNGSAADEAARQAKLRQKYPGLRR